MEVVQAFKFRIDPNPAAVSALRSHAGGSRVAYNALRELVLANWAQVAAEKDASGDGTHATPYLGTSQFDLLRVWATIRDQVAPWWAENSAQAYNDAAIRLSRAFANRRAGRARLARRRTRRDPASVKF